MKEYLVEEIEVKGGYGEGDFSYRLHNLLNNFGKKGWTLKTISHVDGLFCAHVIFEREDG